MKTKTINLYQFHELTTEQQAEVIEKYRDINDDVFDSYVSDECNTLELFENGFLSPSINYDLSYSQGSGACFDCSEFDFDLLLKDWKHKHKKWIINILKNHYECHIIKNNYGYHYSHSKTRYFTAHELFYNTYVYVESAVNNAIEYIENLRYQLAENLTNRLYDQLEWLRDDEQIKETLIANEYYFNDETLEIEL